MTKKELDDFIKEHGYNPTVTTEGSRNIVDIAISLKINKEDLIYLKNLQHRDKSKLLMILPFLKDEE